MYGFEQLWPEDSFPGERYPAQARLAIHRPVTQSSERAPAVVIIPGGGYGINAPEEGAPVARRLAAHGLWAFVVFYRVAPHRFPAPFSDACRAVRRVRELAQELPLDPGRISLLGFSAGGHLAGLVAARSEWSSGDPLSSVSARPDRLALVYPVISMLEDVHGPSLGHLLGRDPSWEQRAALSLERQVSAALPPTLLVHAQDDEVVPISHAHRFARACAEHGVEARLHVAATGGHGFVLDPPAEAGLQVERTLVSWLRDESSDRV